jgi:hypothetical protein
MTKPTISSLDRLTNQNTNTPPDMVMVWLPLPLLSHDPIPAAAAVTGRHLMRMESDDI